MARQPRLRIKGAYYHIICRSLSEFNLFKDELDKTKYLDILFKSTEEFNASLTSFCLLDTHVHFIINPNKINISHFMKKVNCTYAKYYNRKYNRHGPVFSDRFKSKIIDSLEYFLTAVCYIHYNILDLGFTQETMKNYPFSSFKDYLTNDTTIVDRKILSEFISKSSYDFMSLHYQYYINKVNKDPDSHLENLFCFDLDLRTYANNQILSSQYSSGYPKQIMLISPSELINKLFSQNHLMKKTAFEKDYCTTIHDLQCIATNLLRSLCGSTYNEIAQLLGNMTISNIYWLNKKGIQLLKSTYNKSTIINSILP